MLWCTHMYKRYDRFLPYEMHKTSHSPFPVKIKRQSYYNENKPALKLDMQIWEKNRVCMLYLLLDHKMKFCSVFYVFWAEIRTVWFRENIAKSVSIFWISRPESWIKSYKILRESIFIFFQVLSYSRSAFTVYLRRMHIYRRTKASILKRAWIYP